MGQLSSRVKTRGTEAEQSFNIKNLIGLLMWWQGTKFLDKEKARGCRLHPFGAHKGTVLKSVDIEAWVRLLELPVGDA